MKTDGSTDFDALFPVYLEGCLGACVRDLEIGGPILSPAPFNEDWLCPQWARTIWLALPDDEALERKALVVARDSEEHRTAMLAIVFGQRGGHPLIAYLDAIQYPIAESNDPEPDRSAS